MTRFLYKGPKDFKDIIKKAYEELEFDGRENPRIAVQNDSSFNPTILNDAKEPMCGSRSVYDIPKDVIIFDPDYLLEVISEEISSENFNNDFTYESARREMGSTKVMKELRTSYKAWIDAENNMLNAMDEQEHSEKLNYFADSAVKNSIDVGFLSSLINTLGIPSVIEGLAFAVSGEERPLFRFRSSDYAGEEDAQRALKNCDIFYDAFNKFLEKDEPEDAIKFTKAMIDESYKSKKDIVDVALDNWLFDRYIIG
ncbi:hypothetical protein KY332_00875 [Candidatus Woesearchaeota archaeon]|nr:hypothetical protein [Candidatus Woesearchaeota archaeon]